MANVSEPTRLTQGRKLAAMVVLPTISLGAAVGIVADCRTFRCRDDAVALIERSPLPTQVPPAPTGGVHVAGTALATTTNSTFTVVSG
jgi:hypothetical protein